VAQDDPKDVGLAPLAVGADERGTRAKVDLGLFARLGLEASYREVRPRCEAMDEASQLK
jgi:hypothetical protein